MMTGARSLLKPIFPVLAMVGMLLAAYRLMHTPDEVSNNRGGQYSPADANFAAPAPVPLVAQPLVYYRESNIDLSPRMTVELAPGRKSKRRSRNSL